MAKPKIYHPLLVTRSWSLQVLPAVNPAPACYRILFQHKFKAIQNTD